MTDDPDHMHSYEYKWYRRDKDGEPMDGGGMFAKGKTIYITGEDVTVKTVFTCEVE